MSERKWIPLMIKRKFYPFTMVPMIEKMKERYGEMGSYTVWKDGLNSTYANRKRVEEDIKDLKKLLKTDPFWVDEFVTWAIKIHEKPVKTAKKIYRKDVESKDDEELAELQEEFLEAEREIGKAIIFLATDNRIEKLLRNYLKEKDVEDVEDVMEKVIAPVRKSANIKKKLSFLEILKDYRKKGEIDGKVESKIENHLKHYAWLGMGTGGEGITKEKVEDKLKTSEKNPEEEIEKIKQDFRQTKQERQEMFEKYNFSDFHRACANYLSESTHIRIFRKETQSQVVYYTKKFYEEIANRLGLDKQELMFLSGRQIVSGLKGEIDQDKLGEISAEQRKLSLCFLKESQAEFVRGEEAEEFLRREGEEVEVEEKKELEGKTVYKGEVEGEAKVVIDSSNMDKVKEGDVLVATQTTPDFTPGIKRAGAVVVEEAGITSHASIICREMQVPALIGVKNATDILEDGDKIKVKAGEGKVKIL